MDALEQQQFARARARFRVTRVRGHCLVLRAASPRDVRPRGACRACEARGPAARRSPRPERAAGGYARGWLSRARRGCGQGRRERRGGGGGRAASAPLDVIASTPSGPALAKRRRTASTAEPAPAAKRGRSGEAAVSLSLLQPRLNATTGFRGVCFHKQTGKYASTLYFNGQNFSCGLHETAEAAAQAYDAEARKQGREECLLNFPHGKPRTEPLPALVHARNAKTGFFGVSEDVDHGKVTGSSMRSSSSMAGT